MNQRLLKAVSLVSAAALMGGIILSGCSGSGNGSNNGGAASTPSGGSSNGAEKTEIVVGRVAPMTGSLASFGKGSLDVEEYAIESINADGGIYLEEYGKKLPVRFVMVDSESDTTKASEGATKLLNESGIDVMITSHTADTVNPVSAACERAGIPCISVDTPADAWAANGPYTYSYHAGFNTENELSCFADAWDAIDSNKTVGILAANDAEGIEMSGAIAEFAESRGYTVVDPGRFTSGTSDYTSIINDLKNAECDILMGVMITPDFSTFWKQCNQQGYVPKLCTIAKATLFVADVEAVAGGTDICDGLVSEVWWTPDHPFVSSITGETSKELGDWWTAKYNEPAPATMGYKYANVEILVDILERAGSLDPQKIIEATAATNLDTCIGNVQYNDEHVSVMNLVTGQWVYEDGGYVQKIVLNTQIPECPLTGELKTLPHSTR